MKILIIGLGYAGNRYRRAFEHIATSTGLPLSLRETPQLFERGWKLLERFGFWYDLWQREGFAPVRQAYELRENLSEV